MGENIGYFLSSAAICGLHEVFEHQDTHAGDHIPGGPEDIQLFLAAASQICHTPGLTETGAGLAATAWGGRQGFAEICSSGGRPGPLFPTGMVARPPAAAVFSTRQSKCIFLIRVVIKVARTINVKSEQKYLADKPSPLFPSVPSAWVALIPPPLGVQRCGATAQASSLLFPSGSSAQEGGTQRILAMAPRKRSSRGISFIFCCFRSSDHPEITYRLRNDSSFALQTMEPALPMPPVEELDVMFTELVVSRMLFIFLPPPPPFFFCFSLSSHPRLGFEF